jgi:hypothetical protein
LRHAPRREHREEIAERDEVEALARRVRGREDAPAKVPRRIRSHATIIHAASAHTVAATITKSMSAVSGLDAALGRIERLPQQEEAEVHQHPGAHEGAAGLGEERAVEREQHRRNDPALGSARRPACRRADVGCRIHGQVAV